MSHNLLVACKPDTFHWLTVRVDSSAHIAYILFISGQLITCMLSSCVAHRRVVIFHSCTGWSKKLEMRWIFCSNPSSDFSDVIVIQFCLIFAARCAAFAVIRCLSVCVSVCLSVTFVHSVKTSTHILRLFSPSGRSVILVFPYETEKQYCDGNPPNGASNARGMQKSRFSTNISLYLGIDEDRAIVTMEGE